MAVALLREARGRAPLKRDPGERVVPVALCLDERELWERGVGRGDRRVTRGGAEHRRGRPEQTLPQLVDQVWPLRRRACPPDAEGVRPHPCRGRARPRSGAWG